MPNWISRRQWTQGALGIAGADLASAWQHAHTAVTGPTPPKFRSLDAAMALEVEALTARIIPSDGSPGASEAGVVYFIDHALGGWERDKLPAYRHGLADLGKRRLELFPASASLAGLAPGELDRLLTAIENTGFFQLLRTHTVLGFLGSPEYGGNRGGVGWAHIGVERKMIFEPPFGYYDAEARKQEPK